MWERGEQREVGRGEGKGEYDASRQSRIVIRMGREPVRRQLLPFALLPHALLLCFVQNPDSLRSVAMHSYPRPSPTPILALSVQALGVDGWVVVPIGSSTREGHSLEGTRLTVVKMGKEAAHLDEDAR